MKLVNVHRRARHVRVTFLILLILSLAWAQERPSSKQPYRRKGNESTLAGTVTLSGTPPEPMQIDMRADPKCYEANPHPFTEFFVVANGRLANVLIYVKESASVDGLSFETPTTNAVFDERGCRFVPHVLGVQVDQHLEIRNFDKTIQNVHPTPKSNPDWNRSQMPYSTPLVTKFPFAEIAIPIKDNQHPWKKGWVGVFSHPFFAVTDSQGLFAIAGLPPGNYTIGAWHEQFGEKTFEVTVAPSSRQTLDVNFDMTERKILR